YHVSIILVIMPKLVFTMITFVEIVAFASVHVSIVSSTPYSTFKVSASIDTLGACRPGLFIFLHAEDGIRDPLVTGVQTCALPIFRAYLGLSDSGVREAYAWQFVTAMFLHNGPWHLLGNMLVLYFLGRDLELILGQRHFLYLYLAGAIGGELGHLFLMPPGSVLLAASGGVAAIVVAYATMLPDLELTGTRFFMVSVHLKAKHL